MVIPLALSSGALSIISKATASPVPFLMPVEDVFTITGRGTVATGRVERGVLHPNEEVEIVVK